MKHKMRSSELPLLLAIAAYFLAQMDQTQCAKVSKRPRTCLDLPEEILEQMFGKLSVGMLSAFHHTLQLAPLEKENLTCPTGGRSSSEKKAQLPVNIQSVSPWAYRVSYDPLRYPKYIPEAYCLCKGCLVGPYGEESLQHRSTPVFMPSVILRRTRSCTGGRYVYTEYYVSIPVGCTCIPETDKETETSNSSLAKEDKVSQENGVKVGLDTGVRTDTV
ncbi:interleukin-17D [Polypterus senegalus]|uniref:interleukin-17D n=1 Tax=Polypterus senegalus TaxID=55291 RepID=UPI001965E725|nr:interleukin-17D [Polypterus senegalus]